MRLIPLLSLIVASLLSLVSAADIQGSIAWNQHLTVQEVLASSTAVVLDTGEYRTLIRRDGSFVLHDVKQGAYVLQVQSRTHIFDPIYITVTNSSIHLQPYNPSHTPLTPTSTTSSLPYPIQLVPLARIQYYEQPQGANIMGLLKNPMVLMLAFTGIMAFVMPKMLANMDLDPEEAKEMAQMQQRLKGFQSTDWSEKLAGALAGKAADLQVAAQADTQAAKAQGGQGGAARRRKGR
ncbi:hypothetical protein NCC49_001164 [Naganishia albida]|nr:hypothetical protein NCC49_001164 [Naganishia albida]